jgi:hypothetical protein
MQNVMCNYLLERLYNTVKDAKRDTKNSQTSQCARNAFADLDRGLESATAAQCDIHKEVEAMKAELCKLKFCKSEPQCASPTLKSSSDTASANSEKTSRSRFNKFICVPNKSEIQRIKMGQSFGNSGILHPNVSKGENAVTVTKYCTVDSDCCIKSTTNNTCLKPVNGKCGDNNMCTAAFGHPPKSIEINPIAFEVEATDLEHAKVICNKDICPDKIPHFCDFSTNRERYPLYIPKKVKNTLIEKPTSEKDAKNRKGTKSTTETTTFITKTKSGRKSTENMTKKNELKEAKEGISSEFDPQISSGSAKELQAQKSAKTKNSPVKQTCSKNLPQLKDEFKQMYSKSCAMKEEELELQDEMEDEVEDVEIEEATVDDEDLELVEPIESLEKADPKPTKLTEEAKENDKMDEKKEKKECNLKSPLPVKDVPSIKFKDTEDDSKSTCSKNDMFQYDCTCDCSKKDYDKTVYGLLSTLEECKTATKPSILCNVSSDIKDAVYESDECKVSFISPECIRMVEARFGSFQD